MTIKVILTEPNKILRQVSKPVDKVGKEEQNLMDDMIETMYQANGIGLAAIQIGIPKKIIVLDVLQKDDQKNPLCFINPVIKKISDEKAQYEEGCLSIPNTFIEIERPKTCLIEYIDIEGKKKIMECDGLLSTCIQHEINHLDGKLIIDFLSKLKKDLIIKKLSKTKQNADRIVV